MISPLDFIFFKIRFRLYSANMIEAYQLGHARKMADYASSKSPFFKEYYADCADFFHLPTINKEIMMNNLTEYNTLGLDKEKITAFALDVEKNRDFSRRFHGINIGMSSGTSGNKGIIITTRAEEDYLKTMYLSRLVIPKNERLNCAFILRVFSPAFNFNSLGYKITYVNQLQPIEKICCDMEKISPNVISSPPSMLKILGKELLKGNLTVKPKLIYSYAETLYPDVKKFIERAFGCRVFQVYQGSEGCYATTCKEGSLHINEDIVLLELFDDKGEKTIPGNPCNRLLVTDLHKKSQPIIRYELNDIVTISKKRCECGSNFRVIESIQGRADDMLWGKRGNKTHFIFPDYVVRAIISCSGRIDDFQVIQKSLDSLKIFLWLSDGRRDDAIKGKVIKEVKDIYSKYGCSTPRISVEFSKPQPNPNSKKLTRVISEVKLA
jgi:putative adenylate-forming enzyme